MSVWFLMWTADIIPWVSGGTIAFITGIYDTLITSLAHINKDLFRMIFAWSFKKAWNYINGTFLVQLFSWIIFAILLLAKTMTYLLAYYPQYVFWFFLWLIIASIVYIGLQITWRKVSTWMALISWILIGYGATWDTTVIATADPSLLSVLVSWAIASMAMILPWISWSYILVLLGKYGYILETLSARMNSVSQGIASWNIQAVFWPEFVVIITFIIGIWCGLLWFSRILQWLLSHHRSFTLAALVGCMIWALHILWPRNGMMNWIETWISGFFVLVWIWIIYVLSKYSPTKKTTS